MDIELKDYMQLIYEATDHEDRKLIATRGFTSLFPFSCVHLYNYAILSGTIEGVLDVNNNGTSPLNIKDDIRNLSVVRKAIQKQEAVYSFGIEFTQEAPATYVAMDMYRSSVLVVPITSNATVIGYACPGSYNGSDSINDPLLQRLTLYGRLIGNALVSLNHTGNFNKLSKRELEILQRISWGETVKEIANNLRISEFTIQDYIKSSIKKLHAHNRIHAVSEALRLGFIT
jgi:DNA-binding CsgD family transcriptional regulator